MGSQAWSFFKSQGQVDGLQQQQPRFECLPSCPADLIEFIPSVNAARVGKVLHQQKTQDKKYYELIPTY